MNHKPVTIENRSITDRCESKYDLENDILTTKNMLSVVLRRRPSAIYTVFISENANRNCALGRAPQAT